MKQELQIKKGEALSEWVDRIADYWHFRDELRETLHEISVTSYAHGSDDTFAVTKAHKSNKKK